MARLGLSFEDVARRNPHILYTSISAYGQTGPYAKRPAHDVNIIAAAGYFATTLDADHAHLQRPRVRIADYLSGMFAAFTIAAMLRPPRSERRAQHLDASMFDAMAYVMLPILQTASAAELRDPLLRNDVLADVAVYRTADGRGVALATLEDKFWAGLVRALGSRFPALTEPVWASRRGRTQDKLRLATTLQALFASLTLAEVGALLPEDEVCWSPLLDGEEVLCDPHVLARGLVRTGALGMGVTSPVMVSGQRAPADAPAPALGEHTAQWMQRVGIEAAAKT
jgi:crotonobetainyl-CoA:carnitine CoA-transferase CaiB-like acyl-CoA transferase